jgi:hypothetical protein
VINCGHVVQDDFIGGKKKGESKGGKSHDRTMIHNEVTSVNRTK